MTAPCIVIGSSHAAAQLSLNIRQQGWQNEIIIIGEERHFPYQKPSLSKSFLSENKTLDCYPIKPQSAYKKAQVKMKLNRRVTEINRKQKTVTLSTGEVLQYSKLAICTGARASIIPLSKNKLKGIHYLRSADDALAIKKELSLAKDVVIIGGGFIGLEVAAVLIQKGIKVTILEAQNTILQRIVSPEVSQFLIELHQSYGVNIETNSVAKQIHGDEYVKAVICESGKKISADMVIIGVGVSPEISLAKQCRLKVDNGIAINQYAQTDDPDIVAAGDCASYFHEIYQKYVRIESIQNALEQSKSAAASINGKQVAFSNNIPRFWSDQYDIKLQICGLIDGYDQIEIEQDLETKKLNVLYLKKKKFIAAIAINNPKFLMNVQLAIKAENSIPQEQITNIFNSYAI